MVRGTFIKHASMRPPLNAGENELLPLPGAVVAGASMRPPLNAGENLAAKVHTLWRRPASMRPPLNAGENAAATAHLPAATRRFNEAPAERGGKLACSDSC